MWKNHTRDYDPSQGQTEEEWARQHAAQGWQTWDAGHGARVNINGHRIEARVTTPLGRQEQ